MLSGDMSEVEYVQDGFSFSGSEELSSISFDFRVIDASEDAALSVKLDSGWPNVSAQEIALPENDEWHNVSVRFSDLQDNAQQAGAVNYGNIVAPFVLERTAGTAHVQLNNIRINCFGESCGLGPKLDGTAPEGVDSIEVFVDGALGELWTDPGVATYTEGGQTITTGTVADDERGDVLQVRYGTEGFGTMYVQSTTAQNLEAFAAGNLVFDLKVMRADGNTDGFLVKSDCGYPCSSNELSVPLPEGEGWHTITVPIQDLMEGSGFNINNVDTPFSLWPVAGQQADVVFRLDNIRWDLAE